MIAKKADENPLFKKVLDSQKAFAQRAVSGRTTTWSTSRWPRTTTSAEAQAEEGLSR